MEGISSYYYDQLTWPEMRTAVAQGRVVVLSVGSTEQHGPHLPLDVDNFLCREICEAVAKRVPDDLLLMPHLSYGFNWHHIDFPGTIGIGWDPYVRFILDIAKSVAHHGFRKMIIVNGHGSNRHLLELVTRQATMDNDLLCAGLGIFALGRKALRQVRESPVGWSSHADEIETSLYLHLRPEGVRTAEMQPENSTVPSKYHWRDIEGGGPLVLMEWWSTFSHTGVLGDPTKATAEKGKIHFDAIVEEMADLIHEFKDRPIRPREDHH